MNDGARRCTGHRVSSRWLAVALLALAGCSRAERGQGALEGATSARATPQASSVAAPGAPPLSSTRAMPGEVPADPAHWLGRVQAAHSRVDRLLAAGQVDAARSVLRASLAMTIPEAVRPLDRRVLLQDTHFRLSQLELGAGDWAEAEAAAGAGLALGRGEDVFTANLLIARGKAREAGGRELDASRDYHEALRINAGLLEALGSQRATPEELRARRARGAPPSMPAPEEAAAAEAVAPPAAPARRVFGGSSGGPSPEREP